MATESELRDLLDFIGDRAPTVEDTLDRLSLQVVSLPAGHRRWLPISATVAAVAVVAVSVLVSVAVRGDGPHHDAATGGPDPTVDQASYPLPLDAYYASATQIRTLQRAQFVLTQRCAKAHGITLPSVAIPANDPYAFLAVANDIRPLTVAQARTIGYEDGGSNVGSAGNPDLAGLTPRQVEIVQGRSTQQVLIEPTGRFLLDGGCEGQATRALLTGATPEPLKDAIASSHISSGEVYTGTFPDNGQPGLFDDDDTVSNIYLNAARYGETSAAMGQAQQRWASCMAAHNYPGLHTTTNTIANLSNLQSASAKREAVRDVQCKQSTGFMAVWVASMTKSQNAVIAAHRPQLAGFKQRLATRMANAAAALK